MADHPEYDDFAETYHHRSTTASPYSAVEGCSFLTVLGPVRGLKFLDLGCGEGRASRMLMARGAGLSDIRWHPLQAPPDAPDMVASMDFYIANPSCLVPSARKPQ